MLFSKFIRKNNFFNILKYVIKTFFKLFLKILNSKLLVKMYLYQAAHKIVYKYQA